MMGSLQLLDIWLQSQKQKGLNSFFETSGSSFIWKILLTPPALKRKIQVQKEVENTLWICEFRKFSQTLPGKKKKPKLTHQWGILKYHPKSKHNQNRKLMPSRNLNPKNRRRKSFHSTISEMPKLPRSCFCFLLLLIQCERHLSATTSDQKLYCGTVSTALLWCILNSVVFSLFLLNFAKPRREFSKWHYLAQKT